MKFSMTVATVGLLLIGSVAANAQALAAPDGLWEISSKDSRYEVTTCGPEGQLCGKLSWLGNGADNAENRPYLNTMLIDHAELVGPGQWKGQLSLFGQTAAGTITQTDNDNIEIRGCVIVVVCKSYFLTRMQ